MLAHAVVLYSQGGKQQEHSPLILEDLPEEEEEELWGPYQKRGGATLD